jgi:ATP-dependent DNA ligase
MAENARSSKARLRIYGYAPAGRTFDVIVVGYYESGELMFVARCAAGFTPALRESLFKQLRELETDRAVQESA